MEKLIYLFVFIIPISYYIKVFEIGYILFLIYTLVLYQLIFRKVNTSLTFSWSKTFFILLVFTSFVSQMILYQRDTSTFYEFLSPYMRLWVYLGMFLLIPLIINTKLKFEKILKWIIISSILPNCVALLQLLGMDIYTTIISYEGIKRIGSTMAHPNFYGYYLVILIIVLIYKLDFKGIKKADISIFIYIIVNVFLLYSTNSRTTLFLGLTLFFIYFFVKLKETSMYKNFKFRAALISFLLIIISFVVIGVVNSAFLAESRFNIAEHNGSFMWRIVKWQTSLAFWSEDPIAIIIGFGWMSSFVYSANSLYEEFAMHNEYIRIIFELGITGFFFYILLLFSILRNIMNFKDDMNTKWFFLLIFLLFILGSSTGNLLGVPENTYYFIIFWAMTNNYRELQNRERYQ